MDGCTGILGANQTAAIENRQTESTTVPLPEDNDSSRRMNLS
jgi:hypothetical protein